MPLFDMTIQSNKVTKKTKQLCDRQKSCTEATASEERRRELS